MIYKIFTQVTSFHTITATRILIYFFHWFYTEGSAHIIRSLRLGNLLYAQNIEHLESISTKLGLSVMIGRCFLIIEMTLGPSGLYCVVNITGFILLFALFC